MQTLVLQPRYIDGYKANQSVQDKAWVAGIGRQWHGATTLVKTTNAVLDALDCSRRACQKECITAMALLASI